MTRYRHTAPASETARQPRDGGGRAGAVDGRPTRNGRSLETTRPDGRARGSGIATDRGCAHPSSHASRVATRARGTGEGATGDDTLDCGRLRLRWTEDPEDAISA